MLGLASWALTTQGGSCVINLVTTQSSLDVISGPDAAAAAGISYRQLDHWARKGWVVPSVQKASGKTTRRVYSDDDVLRLKILRHFAEAGCSLPDLATELSALALDAEFLVRTAEAMTEVTDKEALIELICRPQMVSVFPLGDERRRGEAPATEPVVDQERRTA